MPLVAISREMGAGGTEIAAKVANALNISLAHHEIADRAESRWSARREVVRDPKAARSPRFKWLRSSATHQVAYVNAEVLSIAAAGSAVFRGWGAAQMFYTVPHVLCVRIGAPFKVRLSRMLERTNMRKPLAERTIREDDEIRSSLVRDYYDRDWRDPNGYDLVINTKRTTVDDAVDEILTLVSRPSFVEDPNTKQTLENLRLEALARATLYHNPTTRDLRIHVKVSGEELILGGIVDNGDQREQVIGALGNISNAISVTSRLRAPTDFHTRTSSI